MLLLSISRMGFPLTSGFEFSMRHEETTTGRQRRGASEAKGREAKEDYCCGDERLETGPQGVLFRFFTTKMVMSWTVTETWDHLWFGDCRTCCPDSRADRLGFFFYQQMVSLVGVSRVVNIKIPPSQLSRSDSKFELTTVVRDVLCLPVF